MNSTQGRSESEDIYTRLLGKLPEIADAVKVFQEPGVQERAFEALSRALGVPAAVPVAPEASEVAPFVGQLRKSTSTGSGKRTVKKSNEVPKAAKYRRSAFSADKGLDFRPTGADAFKEFAALKSPKSLNEQNAVSVFYLRDFMKIGQVGVSHVLAAFREAGWKPAAYPHTALQKTASEKGWIDTSNTGDIKMTPGGEYFVEHELPKKK